MHKVWESCPDSYHGCPSLSLAPFSYLYSPKCVEGEFCELRLYGVLGSSCVRPRTRTVYYCEHPSCWTEGRNRGSLCPQSSRAGDTRLNASPSLASHIVPECITCARLWSAPGHSSRSSSSTVVLTTSSEPSTSSVKARCCSSASLTPMRKSQFMLIHTERPSPLASCT